MQRAIVLVVSEDVLDLAGGLLLDGETVDPSDPASLPTGEGLPGGDAVIGFTVLPPAADVDGDGLVNVTDLIEVILSWGPCPDPPVDCPADIDGDGDVGVGDLIEVILNWS